MRGILARRRPAAARPVRGGSTPPERGADAVVPAPTGVMGGGRRSAERGQATVEWAGLVLLVAAVLSAAAATVLDASWLPRALRCALAGAACDGGAADARAAEREALAEAYGPAVARAVRAHAPGIAYERGTLTLPVDFRRCQSHTCSDAPNRPGPVARSARGQLATAFSRVLDRRASGGHLFVQYWLYYPDSTWNGALRRLAGSRAPGYHLDDWESYQVRIGPDGHAYARASSHKGYSGHRRPLGYSQHLPRGAPGYYPEGWVPATGWTRVSRGSHAGHLVDGPGGERHTPAPALRLVPLEGLSAHARATGFAVSPPWRKRVYADPELSDT